MTIVNVAVMAPALGSDFSYITAVDPRVRAFDVSDASDNESRHDRAPRANVEGHPRTLHEIDHLLAEADVLLVGYPVPSTLARRAPRLTWAHHTQAGVSNLIGTDLWTSPVLLTSSRGLVATTAIAEYVLAAAGHFARGLHEGTRQKQAGAFSRDGYEMATLGGTTMGIIGLGGIGREVARLSRAVGMRVVGTRRSTTVPITDADGADLVLPADRLLEVAAMSDYLVICSQLTLETKGLIDDRVFRSMRPSAVLINVARGEEVDEEALVSAVTEGRIRGAVLDVFDGELAGRPPRADLTELLQILLTPHISSAGDQLSVEPRKRLFAGNLRRFLDGQPLLNVVDRERGY